MKIKHNNKSQNVHKSGTEFHYGLFKRLIKLALRNHLSTANFSYDHGNGGRLHDFYLQLSLPFEKDKRAAELSI